MLPLKTLKTKNNEYGIAYKAELNGRIIKFLSTPTADGSADEVLFEIDLSKLNPFVMAENIALNGSSDFNAYTTPGLYYVNTYNGTGGNGVISNIFGYMFVYKQVEDTHFQLLIGKGVIYTRNTTDSGASWTEWSPVHPVVNKLTARYDGSSNFDSILTAGEYYINTGSGSGGTNAPSNVYGVLSVYKYSDSQVFQEAKSFGSNKTVRRYTNNNGETWTSWVEIGGGTATASVNDDGNGNLGL